MTRALLVPLLVLAAATCAPAQEPAALDAPAAVEPVEEGALEAPLLALELQLRAYAIFPKFRFRDGVAGVPGSSLRTQELGLDDWTATPGGQVAVWVGDDARLALEGWTLTETGTARAGKDLLFRGVEVPAGTKLAVEYTLSYAAFEVLHRLEPTAWLWLDLGARLEYLDFRIHLEGVGRTALEAAWPTARVHVGVRPFAWLELEGRFGGFELTVPLGSTHVEQPYEVGGLVRLVGPGGAYLELGGLMYHVHLEEAPGEPEEDALHLRHRALFVSLGIQF